MGCKQSGCCNCCDSPVLVGDLHEGAQSKERLRPWLLSTCCVPHKLHTGPEPVNLGAYGTVTLACACCMPVAHKACYCLQQLYVHHKHFFVGQRTL